jgi:hypothetical protein
MTGTNPNVFERRSSTSRDCSRTAITVELARAALEQDGVWAEDKGHVRKRRRRHGDMPVRSTATTYGIHVHRPATTYGIMYIGRTLDANANPFDELAVLRVPFAVGQWCSTGRGRSVISVNYLVLLLFVEVPGSREAERCAEQERYKKAVCLVYTWDFDRGKSIHVHEARGARRVQYVRQPRAGSLL